MQKMVDFSSDINMYSQFSNQTKIKLIESMKSKIILK